jgi:thiaminase/transcriptional activator TenA
MLTLTDDVAREAGPAERRRMLAAFQHSARLEWMFWDSAYRMEAWPVAGG